MNYKETVIKPKQKWFLFDLNELWRYRELFIILTWRDIKVRYKQTVLGIVWVIFQPIVTMIIFTVLFGRLAKIPSGGLPYQLFVLIGLVFWNFFSQAVTSASNSLLDNVAMIKKVYFPREIPPISATITHFVDFIINFFLLLSVGFYLRLIPSLEIFWVLPVCVVITLISSSGLGLFLASVNMKYRDVRYILPFFIQIMLFLTPVIYPTSSVRSSFRIILALNPMTGVIEAMRAVFDKTFYLDFRVLVVSFVVSIALFIIGLIYFRSTERFFADIS